MRASKGVLPRVRVWHYHGARRPRREQQLRDRRSVRLSVGRPVVLYAPALWKVVRCTVVQQPTAPRPQRVPHASDRGDGLPARLEKGQDQDLAASLAPAHAVGSAASERECPAAAHGARKVRASHRVQQHQPERLERQRGEQKRPPPGVGLELG